MGVLNVCAFWVAAVLVGDWVEEGGVVLCLCDVCAVSLDYLYISQVQVSVYCAMRIPAHLRCTQDSIDI